MFHANNGHLSCELEPEIKVSRINNQFVEAGFSQMKKYMRESDDRKTQNTPRIISEKYFLKNDCY